MRVCRCSFYYSIMFNHVTFLIFKILYAFFAVREQAEGGKEKNDACSFFSAAAHESGKEEKYFAELFTSPDSLAASFLCLLSAKTRNFPFSVSESIKTFSFFRRISGKISRFKGCEYVYVNGKSLKIYINLWILCMRHREQESRVR